MPIVHIILHFIVPLACGLIRFGERWHRATWLMIATMAVDLDHLLAVPIYDADRCSINFHPLHSSPAIVLYVVACIGPLVIQKTSDSDALRPRLWTIHVIACGLVLHMLLDGLDCLVHHQFG